MFVTSDQDNYVSLTPKKIFRFIFKIKPYFHYTRYTLEKQTLNCSFSQVHRCIDTLFIRLLATVSLAPLQG